MSGLEGRQKEIDTRIEQLASENQVETKLEQKGGKVESKDKETLETVEKEKVETKMKKKKSKMKIKKVKLMVKKSRKLLKPKQ